MISPQESGLTSTTNWSPVGPETYSWNPNGGYDYWRQRIGKDIAEEILAACEYNAPCDQCRYCASVARGQE